MKMENGVICLDSSESESDDEFEGKPAEKNPPKTSFESNMVLSIGRVKVEDPFDDDNHQNVSKPTQRKRGPKKKITTCSICKKECVGMAMYHRHMRSFHRSTNVVAAQRRTRVEAKKVYRKGASLIRTYVCPFCKKHVSGRGPLTNHMMNVHGAKHNPSTYDCVTKCPVCYVTINRVELNGHLSKIHNTSLQKLSPFFCSECDQQFLRFANLLHHEKKAHEKADPSPKVPKPNHRIEPVKEDENPKEEEHTCSKCQRTFSSRNWLVRHGLDCGTKKKISAFPCSWCPAVFTIKFSKQKHEKSCRLRPNSNKNVIRKKPKSSDDDETEIITRPNRIPRKCNSSHFSYVNKSPISENQNEFRKIQTRMPRKCKTRNISYVNESSSEVEFPNDFIQFGDKHSGWINDRTPGGVKIVYADKLCCSYCPKFLSSISSKLLHEKLHTGEMAYQCKHCKAAFRLAKKTLDHEKKCLSMIGSIWCPFCDYNDKVRYKVENHCMSFHEYDMSNNKFLSYENTSKDEQTSDDEFPRENIPSNGIQVSNTKNIPSNDSQTFDRFSTMNIPRNGAQTLDDQFLTKNIPSNTQTFDDRFVTKNIPPNDDQTSDQTNYNVEVEDGAYEGVTVITGSDNEEENIWSDFNIIDD